MHQCVLVCLSWNVRIDPYRDAGTSLGQGAANKLRAMETCEKQKDKSLSIMLMLWSEIPSGMCAKLRTVAARNNRDQPTRSLSSSPLASTINCSPGSQALLEVTHQDHTIGITLLLLVRATYIYYCSSRTSRSWWITQPTQHHQRGCNTYYCWTTMFTSKIIKESIESLFQFDLDKP